ncbi:MAG: FkbM family methyltransferase [Hyphomicrobiales bacterium]
MDGDDLPASVHVLLWLTRNTPLGRGTAKRWMYAMIARAHPGPIAAQFHGAPMVFHHHDNVVERKALMQPAVVDRQEIAFLQTAMKEAGSVFVDIGANAGLYSVAIAQAAGTGSRLVTFEPNPVMGERLAANLALNARVQNGDIQVQQMACAIGDEETTLPLRIAGGDHGAGSLVENQSDAVAFTVPVRPLLDVLRELSITKITALKIDVEGFEDAALGPFFDSAPTDLLPGTVLIEHIAQDRWTRPIIKDLLALGYSRTLTTRNNTGLLRSHPPTRHH